MKKTLKDLFIENNCYIAKIELDKNFYLFIEGLNEYGEMINGEFNIKNIKNILVEIFDDYDIVENVNNVKLTDTIEQVKAKAIKEMRKGYRIITGLNNDKQFNDKELLEYMRDVLYEKPFEDGE